MHFNIWFVLKILFLIFLVRIMIGDGLLSIQGFHWSSSTQDPALFTDLFL